MRKTGKVIVLGNCLYPEYTKGAFAGMCYAVNGIAPALLTMGGGNRQPFILTICKQDKRESDTNGEKTEVSGVTTGRKART